MWRQTRTIFPTGHEKDVTVDMMSLCENPEEVMSRLKEAAVNPVQELQFGPKLMDLDNCSD